MAKAKDIKKEDEAIREFAHSLGVGISYYPKEELSKFEKMFSYSETVNGKIGIGAVSEPSAYIASNYGKLVVPKTIYKGVVDTGATALGGFTGNPVLGMVGSQLANHAIDGLGLKGKGSQAMRDRMAHLRSLRKDKKRLNI